MTLDYFSFFPLLPPHLPADSLRTQPLPACVRGAGGGKRPRPGRPGAAAPPSGRGQRRGRPRGAAQSTRSPAGLGPAAPRGAPRRQRGLRGGERGGCQVPQKFAGGNRSLYRQKSPGSPPRNTLLPKMSGCRKRCKREIMRFAQYLLRLITGSLHTGNDRFSL